MTIDSSNPAGVSTSRREANKKRPYTALEFGESTLDEKKDPTKNKKRKENE